MAEEIKLLGFWASLYSRRVELVLKLKGINFQYIEEEDLSNKSDLLLNSNPIHKKVPVFFHNGNPISESLIIIQYIDETWEDHNPVLLPKDPYERANSRFWAKFVDEKVLPTAVKGFIGKGKEQEEAIEEFSNQVKFLEGEVEGKEYFGGERIGFVDVAAFFTLHWIGVMQEVRGGAELMSREKFPVISEWVERMKESDVVMGCLPPREKLVDYIRAGRAAREKKAAASKIAMD